MLYCRRCNVTVHGKKTCCPLCRGELTGEADGDVFPIVKKEEFNRNFALRLISFIAITVIVLSFALDLMIFGDIWLALPTAAAAACLWLSVSSAIIQREHVFVAIIWQMFFISGALVLWDLCIGWQGWSLDFAIPCDCLASLFLMPIMAKIMKIPAQEYLAYLTVNAVYGLLPLVFIFTGCLHNIYPSWICVIISAILLAALALFSGKSMKDEMGKKFHF